MRSGRVTATAVKGYQSTMRFLGYTIAATVVVLVLAANAQPVDKTASGTDISVPTQKPHWNGIYAKTFPGCVGTGSFIPARIVVVSRNAGARTMPYSDATVARINATWDNDNPTDDLFTIGKCAR